VACCMAGQVLLVWVWCGRGGCPAPTTHCTVPAPNTSPPLDDRYRLEMVLVDAGEGGDRIGRDSNTRPAGEYQAMYLLVLRAPLVAERARRERDRTDRRFKLATAVLRPEPQ